MAFYSGLMLYTVKLEAGIAVEEMIYRLFFMHLLWPNMAA